MLAALITLAEGPRVAWEPGVLERRRAALPAAKSPIESDNGKPNSPWIQKTEFVLAAIKEPVFLVRHAVQAPGAKPIAFTILRGCSGAVGCKGLGKIGHDYLGCL